MKKRVGGEVRVSQKFVTALAIVSILGFLGIMSQSFFGFDSGEYIECFLMLIIGSGLIIEAKVKKLKSLSKGITSSNITHLTTVIIGLIAIVAGVFSFPLIRIVNPSFLAIKGIISIIAIVVIIIQTWVID
ncbi:hypothetical protein KAJ87_02085 [Candidatus Pacearchaeota archaeon]|nr:hypothetical protein [Candidatus Pacearchaeota archaeon]